MRNFHEIVDSLALLATQEYRPGSLAYNFWVWEESRELSSDLTQTSLPGLRPTARGWGRRCPYRGRPARRLGAFGIPGLGPDTGWRGVAWLQSLRGCWLICAPAGLLILAGRLAPKSLPSRPSALRARLGSSQLSAVGGRGCGGAERAEVVGPRQKQEDSPETSFLENGKGRLERSRTFWAGPAQ